MRSAVVNAGGDLRVMGDHAQPVHIRDPGDPTRAIFAGLLRNGVIATSCAAATRRTIRGVGASALVGSRDRAPILDTNAYSVLAPRCVVADALTKVVAQTGRTAAPYLERFGATALVTPPRAAAACGAGGIVRLGEWHRRLLLATLIAVAASGVLWFVLRDLMAHEPGELLRNLLVVHGVASFASAIAFGSVLPLHVVAGCRQGRNRITGLVLAGAMIVLIVSALVVYYGGEEARAWARVLHLVVGFLAVIAVPLHMVVGRCRNVRERQKQEW